MVAKKQLNHAFDSSKKWSDFLGFHIRCVFFAFLSIILLGVAITTDGPVHLNLLGRIVAFGGAALFAAYSVVMVIMIFEVSIAFLSAKYPILFGSPRSTLLVVTGVVFLVFMGIVTVSLSLFVLQEIGMWNSQD